MGLVDRLTSRSCVLFLGESKTEVGEPPYRLVRDNQWRRGEGFHGTAAERA